MTDDQVSPAEELRRDDLATAARELKSEVTELRASVDNLGERTTRAERASFRSLALAVVLLVVVALLGVTAYQQYATSARLGNLTQRALCPVFALVVGGYDPSTRPEGPAREKYETNFQVMRNAYVELECVSPLVPPREGP